MRYSLCVAASSILLMSACAQDAPTPVAAQTLCDESLNAAATLNSFNLFSGVSVCAEDDRKEDANYLIILAQIRALSDMTVFSPASDESEQIIAELYGYIFYTAGGPGFEEVYRSADSMDSIEKRVRDTDLSYSENYDPGWNFTEDSKMDVYDEVVQNTLNNRLWQIKNLSLTFQNDDYWNVQQQLNALQAENPVFEIGTPAYEEHARLMAKSREISDSIEQLPPPEDTMPHDRLNEQTAYLQEAQLYTGFNGPSRATSRIIRSEEELRDSWAGKAMTAEALTTLLSRVDFSENAILAYAFGERRNASGEVLISDIGLDADKDWGGFYISTWSAPPEWSTRFISPAVPT